MRIAFDVPKEGLIDAISSLDYSEIVGLVVGVLRECANVELDEQLVGKLWPTIVDCYLAVGEKPPSIEDLVKQHGK